jgi:hypothetical protein
MLRDLATCAECGGTVWFSPDDVARGRTVRRSGGCDATLKDE